jgi:hypothetical protein
VLQVFLKRNIFCEIQIDLTEPEHINVKGFLDLDESACSLLDGEYDSKQDLLRKD